MKRARSKAARSGGDQPTWLVTFADLMTLLLTFFILLLSFSKMDTEKYKAIASAMSQAFGVSFVPSSRGVPDLHAITVPQEVPSTVSETAALSTSTSKASPEREVLTVDEAALKQAQFSRNEDLASELIQKLENPIERGDVTVDYDESEVMLRFSERAAFPSGSDRLNPDITLLIREVALVLKSCQGEILVSGHTDNQPLSGGRFRSNWDLSAARAVSVVHELILDGSIEAKRVLAAGHAETRPLVPNNSPENRALNRRVEIHIKGTDCEPNKV